MNWAVALRDLARGDTSIAGRALLEQKMADMLRYDVWQFSAGACRSAALDDVDDNLHPQHSITLVIHSKSELTKVRLEDREVVSRLINDFLQTLIVELARALKDIGYRQTATRRPDNRL